MVRTLNKILLLNFFVLFQLSEAFAQPETTPDSTNLTVNIESYTDNLSIYAFGISKFSNFDLKEAGQKQDSVLRYSPNSNLNLGLGFSYKWIAFGAAFNFGFINNDETLKGKTTSLDLQLDIYTERMIFNANFQYYEGYYWKNPEVFFPDWSINDSLVVRPDVSTITFGLNGIYIFNHKDFSFKAAYQYSERQLKSAGSMLLGSRFSLYGFNADSSVVPSQLHEFYPNLTDIGSLSSVSFGASFGYTYTLVFGKYFFVNALLMTGLNAQLLAVNDLNDEQINNDAKLSTNITFRAAMGFNKPKVYYGMSFINDTFLLRNSNNTELSYKYGKFHIYYGIRFGLGKG